MSVLEVQGLVTVYQIGNESLRAVDNVSFSIGKGESVGIVGESGSGKSTLALSIPRLIRPPGKIVSGKILFEQKNVIDMSEDELRKIRGAKIGMVFQQPHAYLNPVIRVGAQVAEVLEEHMGYDHDKALKEAVNLFKEVGIPSPDDAVKRYPFELSGGMAQRVMIAMAIACSPSLLIADEPTSSLDVTVQAQILEKVKELRQKYDTSLLLITHDLALASDSCEKVIVMYAGKIVERGKSENVLFNPKHPYTQMLIASIPRIGMKEDLAEIPGSPPSLTRHPSGCRFHPRCPYAMKICAEQEPRLMLTEDREVACHLYKET